MHHSGCIDDEGEGKVATFAGEVARVKEVMVLMEWGAGGLRRKEQKETYENIA